MCHLRLIVPPDGAVGAGAENVLPPLGLFGIDEDNAILSPVDGPIFCEARGIIAVHAWHGQIDHVHHRVLPPFLALDIDPPVPMPRLSNRVRQKVVLAELVLAGQEAVVAVMTLGYIDDQTPLAHAIPPSSFSTSTRQEFGAWPDEFLVMNRCGVRMLMHPPRSADLPGSPTGT